MTRRRGGASVHVLAAWLVFAFSSGEGRPGSTGSDWQLWPRSCDSPTPGDSAVAKSAAVRAILPVTSRNSIQNLLPYGREFLQKLAEESSFCRNLKLANWYDVPPAAGRAPPGSWRALHRTRRRDKCRRSTSATAVERWRCCLAVAAWGGGQPVCCVWRAHARHLAPALGL